MSNDFNKPVMDDEYVEIFQDIRDVNVALATMFEGGTATNTPTGAVQYLGGVLGRWNGSSFVATQVSIAGGGTGGGTATAARTNLELLSTTEINAQFMRKDSNGSDIADGSIFRGNIDVPSSSEAALNASNLSNLDNASTAFGNIKQAATTASSGVVEEATAAEMRSGTNGKFPDAATIKTDRAYQLVWNQNAFGVVTDAAISTDTGFTVIPGRYIIQGADNNEYSIEVRDIAASSQGTSKINAGNASPEFSAIQLFRDGSSSFQLREYRSGLAGTVASAISSIYFSPI